MQHLMTKTVHIFRIAYCPPYHNYRLACVYIGIGQSFVGFAFDHKTVSVFERNTAASQIPKTPFHHSGILRAHITHHMHSPSVPFQVNLLLSHSTNQ